MKHEISAFAHIRTNTLVARNVYIRFQFCTQRSVSCAMHMKMCTGTTTTHIWKGEIGSFFLSCKAPRRFEFLCRHLIMGTRTWWRRRRWKHDYYHPNQAYILNFHGVFAPLFAIGPGKNKCMTDDFSLFTPSAGKHTRKWCESCFPNGKRANARRNQWTLWKCILHEHVLRITPAAFAISLFPPPYNECFIIISLHFIMRVWIFNSRRGGRAKSALRIGGWRNYLYIAIYILSWMYVNSRVWKPKS